VERAGDEPGARLPDRLARLASAAPELAASATYLTAWVAPGRLDPGLIRMLLLGMLVEFLVVHSNGMLGGIVFGTRGEGRSKAGLLAGLGALYLLFAGAFSLAFGSWMPLATIGWLLGSRFWTLVVDPRGRDEERARQMSLWVLSGAVYVLGVFVTILPPLPELGLDAAVRAALDLPGEGLWIDQPHRVMAFGFLYFGILAWAELKLPRDGGELGRVATGG